MKRRTLLVLAGLVVFVVGLVSTFPARVAIDAFAPATVQAWGVEGTVWNGKAAALAVNGIGVGSLEWSLSPWSLLVLRPSAEITVRRLDGFASTHVSTSLSGDSVRLTGLEAAGALETLPRQVVPQGTAGQFSIQFEELTLTDQWPTRAVGRVAASDLKIPGVKFAIGPLEFVFPEEADPPAAAVRSLGGPLAVEGTLALPAPGRWALDAVIGPGENAPRELVQGLAYVGEEVAGGKRRVLYTGGH